MAKNPDNILEEKLISEEIGSASRSLGEGWCSLSEYLRTFSFENICIEEIKNLLAIT